MRSDISVTYEDNLLHIAVSGTISVSAWCIFDQDEWSNASPERKREMMEAELSGCLEEAQRSAAIAVIERPVWNPAAFAL